MDGKILFVDESTEGHLCGQCMFMNNHCLFIVRHFLCVNNALCSWGTLFYLVSEILTGDDRFLGNSHECQLSDCHTTGGVNSFIVMAQLLPLPFFSKANR